MKLHKKIEEAVDKLLLEEESSKTVGYVKLSDDMPETAKEVLESYFNYLLESDQFVYPEPNGDGLTQFKDEPDDIDYDDFSQWFFDTYKFPYETPEDEHRAEDSAKGAFTALDTEWETITGDYVSDYLSNEEEEAAERRDPYGYRGLSRSDFV